jgi:very-short-patch-repair endonuclease
MDDLYATAEDHHGLISGRQLDRLGIGPDARHQLVLSGRWERVTPSVLRLVGAPRTKEQRARAALLDAGHGAALSHRSATSLWDLPGFFLEPFDISRMRDRSDTPSRLATIHHPRSLTDDHVTTLDGLRVTTPVRTIFDLANLSTRGQVHPDKVERTLDTAWAKQLLNHRLLVRTLDELAERGRGGITLMRRLIGDRGPGYRPPESGLEARFQAILRDRAMAPMRRQVEVGGSSQWLGRVDFCDPGPSRYIVQIDSERFHGSLVDQRADAFQTAALRAAGFIVRRFWDTEVWYQPSMVAKTVRADRLQARHRSAGHAA